MKRTAAPAMPKAFIRQQPTALSIGLQTASTACSSRSPPASHVVQPYTCANSVWAVTSGRVRFRSPKRYSSRFVCFNSNTSYLGGSMISLSHSPPSSSAARFHSLPKCALPAMQTSAPRNLDNDVSPKQTLSAPTNADESLGDLCALLDHKITTFLNNEPSSKRLRDVQRQTKISLEVLKEAVERYGLEKVALSYNGGKDCLVLLILWLVTLHRYCRPSHSSSNGHRGRFPDSVETVYIQARNSFEEVDAFVGESSRQYHLNLCTLPEPMKAAFEDYLKMKPKIELIFVGTRRTDPHGSMLSHFVPTDGNWPRFMRCHPVIDWHYCEIWEFIRHFEIPYCSLYDAGFTSLGGTEDTHPNPKLKIETVGDADGAPAKYRPAFELVDDDEERLGRNSA